MRQLQKKINQVPRYKEVLLAGKIKPKFLDLKTWNKNILDSNTFAYQVPFGVCFECRTIALFKFIWEPETSPEKKWEFFSSWFLQSLFMALQNECIFKGRKERKKSFIELFHVGVKRSQSSKKKKNFSSKY